MRVLDGIYRMNIMEALSDRMGKRVVTADHSLLPVSFPRKLITRFAVALCARQNLRGGDMLKLIWKKVVLVVIILGALLSFFAIIELIRAYQVLRDVHPLLGFLYVLLLFTLIVFGILYYVVSVARRPPLLIPPEIDDLSSAGRHDLDTYGNYLVRLMQGLSDNDNIVKEGRESIRVKCTVLKRAVKDAGKEDLRQLIIEILEKEIKPHLNQLSIKAEKEVQNCVRDVMIGVAVSPWRAVDLLVVIYRNIKMVIGVMNIYERRPSLKAQTRILCDIVKIVATVNILNYGSKLAQNLFSSMPFAGRFVDDIAQGAGAGLFTSMAGHAAIERCSIVHAWSEIQAQEKMVVKVKMFAGDLKEIVVADVLPLLKGRIAQPDVVEKPDREESVRSGIERAMDATSSAMDDFVKRPVAAVGTTAATTGKIIFETTKKGCKATWSGVSRAGCAVGRGMRTAGAKAKSLLRRRPGKTQPEEE